MWIVQVALRRPYTFIVLALLLPLIGALAIMGTPLRPGMPPDDMAGRITAQVERYATTLVNDIEHVESRSYPGMAVVKIFFQPGVDINLAMSQVTAFGQTILRAGCASCCRPARRSTRPGTNPCSSVPP